MAPSVVHSSICFLVFFSVAVLIPSSSGQQYCIQPSPYGQLTPDYYKVTCPNVYNIVADIVQQAIKCDPRMGASLLRLHFHDCWVNGCDASVLLIGLHGEQSAFANANSLRGFDVIAAIKSALNQKCPCGNVVSCADILAIAASESVKILGGPCYKVLLGRKDSLNATTAAANANLPSPFSNVTTLLANFATKNFGAEELVALSGAHTLGRARCGTFMGRATANQSIDPAFAKGLQDTCAAGGNITAPLDNTTNTFDLNYFKMLKDLKGLLKSDQELYSGVDQGTISLVKAYSDDQPGFWKDFVSAMIKMGNLPPTDDNGKILYNGEVRCNCSIPNAPQTPLQKIFKDCPVTAIACPSCPPVVLTSLFNIGLAPTNCPNPVASSPDPGNTYPQN